MSIKRTALTFAFVTGVWGAAFNLPAYADGNGCLTVDCQEYSHNPGDRCSYDQGENACECGEENTCYCSTGEYEPCASMEG
jgi:hypothetical protein